jgi:hypothetical protein
VDCTNFWVSLAQKSRNSAVTNFRKVRQQVATNFKAVYTSFITVIADTLYGFLGTEIEELFGTVFKVVCGGTNFEICLIFNAVAFCCKRILSQSSENNKIPSHWFSPCGFFQGLF